MQLDRWRGGAKKLATVKHYGAVTKGIGLAEDGKVIVDGGGSGLMYLWGVSTGELLATVGEPSKFSDLFTRRQRLGHNGMIQAFTVDGQGQRLATAGDDRLVMVWDIPAGQHRATFAGHKSKVSMVTFLPGNEAILSVGSFGDVIVWDVLRGDKLMSLDLGTQPRCIAVSADGKRLAGGGRRVHVFEIPSGRAVPCRDELLGDLYSLAFAPSGHLLAVGTFAGARLWDMNSLAEVGTFGPRSRVETLSFSLDSTLLAIVSPISGKFHVVDVRSGETLPQFHRQEAVAGATFAGDTLVVSQKNGVRALVDPTSGEEVTHFKHVNLLRTVTAVGDGDLIATVGESGSMTKDATIVWGPA